MSTRPVIGVATQSLDAIPGKLPACWVMGQRYVRVLASAGAVPVLLPLLHGDEETLRLTYEQLDGVFLTGGVDVDPACYGEPRHEHCDRTDPARDWTEITLVRWALADRKPILGVCRGMQVINVACGGSLYQHVPDAVPLAAQARLLPRPATQYTRDYLAHAVEVGRRLTPRPAAGRRRVDVNSMHHQGIKRLAPGLRASASRPTG